MSRPFLQISRCPQRPLGNYLGDYFGEYLQEYLRKMSWNLREVSWNFGICENGREILQKCPRNFIDPQLKVGMATRIPGDSGEFLGEEIFQERRFYLKTTLIPRCNICTYPTNNTYPKYIHCLDMIFQLLS